MIEYVCGFAFLLGENKEPSHVLLIEKSRPAWQFGRLNGLGGHIEPGETSWQAMVREFHEEAGIQTQQEDWDKVAIEQTSEWRVHYFKTTLSPSAGVQAQRDIDEGIISAYRLSDLRITPLVRGIEYFLSMAIYGQGNHRRIGVELRGQK